MAGSLKKKPGMGKDQGPGKALPGKKKKRNTKVPAVKKGY